LGLQEALVGTEHLNEENQYYCSFCEKKVDATRRISLMSLPPYLCFSLKRFIFDMKVNSATS
jgi:ubiquitin C-terminal hydrolase